MNLVSQTMSAPKQLSFNEVKVPSQFAAGDKGIPCENCQSISYVLIC